MPLLPTRVIFSSDTNPDYVTFWPIVARFWTTVHKTIRPTLIFVGPKTAPIDQTCGDVIVVESTQFPGLATSFVAQVIRLLAPTLFPDDICVVSDIDLFLLKSTFFHQYGLATMPETCFVSLNRYPPSVPHLSMCYQVGLGSTFQAMLRLPVTSETNLATPITAIIAKVREWARLPLLIGETRAPNGGIPWSRDEKLLTKHLTDWQRRGGVWYKVFTPGIWGKGDAGRFIVSRFANCQTPANLATLVEFEPRHPLSVDYNLAKQIFAACTPEFQLPPLVGMYSGDSSLLQASSRHPEKAGLAPQFQRITGSMKFQNPFRKSVPVSLGAAPSPPDPTPVSNAPPRKGPPRPKVPTRKTAFLQLRRR